MTWIIVLMVLVMVGVAILTQLPQLVTPQRKSSKLSSDQKAEDIPYRLRSALFSSTESDFYTVLSEAVPKTQIVFGKVRVADVLQPISGLPKSRWQIAFNRISAKHFDYVICERSNLSVKLVVELNDRSHQKAKRVIRDQFLRFACKSAGLPLIEFQAQSSYARQDVMEALSQVQ